MLDMGPEYASGAWRQMGWDISKPTFDEARAANLFCIDVLCSCSRFASSSAISYNIIFTLNSLLKKNHNRKIL